MTSSADAGDLHGRRHRHQVQPVAQHADRQHAEQRPGEPAIAALERRAADRDRRDGVELEADAAVGCAEFMRAVSSSAAKPAIAPPST